MPLQNPLDTESPIQVPAMQDGIKQRSHTCGTGRNGAGIDGAGAWFVDAVEWFANARVASDVRISTAGAVAPAYLALLCELQCDFFPVKRDIRI